MTKNILFWGDLHIGHQNAYKFPSKDGDRQMRPFNSLEDCELLMVENYNKIVKDNDIVYFLGDVILDKKRSDVLSFMKKGAKHLILGNHDNKGDVEYYRNYFDKVYGVLYLPKLKSILSHIPVHSSFLGPQDYLNNEVRFEYNIHGHCVSEDTEILTKRGWKTRKELLINEEVYSLNSYNELVTDYVKDIHCVTEQTFYEVESKGLRMKLTDNHKITLLGCKKDIKYELAKDVFNKKTNVLIPRSACYKTKGLEFSNDLIKLYIYLVADGTIKKETNLCRLIIKKDRKIKIFSECLKKLNIEYKQYKQKDGSISLNFYLPEPLLNINIKGLDIKLLDSNREQCKVILEAYKQSDGNRNLIFTSKKTEVDILQHMLCINGFSVKVYERKGHGFSKDKSYQLSVTDRQCSTLTNPSRFKKQTNILYDIFWCPEIKNNHNFIARYKGSVFITGNCHDNHIMLSNSKIKDQKYLNTCVEVVDYKPVTFEELKEINKVC